MTPLDSPVVSFVLALFLGDENNFVLCTCVPSTASLQHSRTKGSLALAFVQLGFAVP